MNSTLWQNSQQKYKLGIFENTKEDHKILPVYKGKSLIQNGIRFLCSTDRTKARPGETTGNERSIEKSRESQNTDIGVEV